MGNQIYTIGREFGSGGKDVGVALARKADSVRRYLKITTRNLRIVFCIPW